MTAYGTSTSVSMPTTRLLLVALVTVLSGGFHFGFQISIVNPMAEIFQEFLAEGLQSKYQIKLPENIGSILWSFIASEVLIGALIGAAFITRMVEKQGPLKALSQSSIIQMVSVLLLAISGFVLSPVLFVVSRLFSGLAIGMSATFQGVFLAEISPDEHRGKIGTLSGLSTSIGFISAAFLGLPYILGTRDRWPVIFVIEAIPCMIFILSSWVWIRESPVYYCWKGELEETEKSIRDYFGGEKDAAYEVAKILKTMKTTQRENAFKEILDCRQSRQALFTSVALNIAVSFSGITAVSFFGTSLLRSLGFDKESAATANLFCSLAGALGAIIATVTTDKIGNRFLILSGLLLLITFDSLMMLFVFVYSVTQENLIGWVFLSLFILFLFSFSAGIGPAAWSIGAELAPVQSRSKVQSAAVSTQYLACFLSPILYYPLSSTVGPLAFLVFIVPLLLIALYLHYSLPFGRDQRKEEVKGCEKGTDPNGNDVVA